MTARRVLLAASLAVALAACGDGADHTPPPSTRVSTAVDEAAWERLAAPLAHGPTAGVRDLLAVPPLVGRATDDGATIHVVGGSRELAVALQLDARADEGPLARAVLAPDASHEFVVTGLPAGRHRYTVAASDGERVQHAAGAFSTRAPPGEAFTLAILADTHLPVPPPEWVVPGARRHPAAAADFDAAHAQVGAVFARVSESIAEAEPDLVLHLGDLMDGRSFGDNPPFPTRAVARHAYLDVRRHLGDAGATAAFYAVIGNWDGENGWHPPSLLAKGRETRLELLPNPRPETYAEGGSAHEDYYALTWGDALLVVLNVMSYTPAPHTLHPDDQGTGEDWTLGAEQLAWFARTLARSDAAHKLVFIHHPVAGRGADADESRYGRGGGRAAHVGEQARVHALMEQHGARALFYGHDHVFTDMVVGGIHYTLPGSAGAPWKFPGSVTGYERWDERSGFALLHVSAAAVTVDFMDVRGRRFAGYTLPGR